jgi:preprotein translocase subunit SecA
VTAPLEATMLASRKPDRLLLASIERHADRLAASGPGGDSPDLATAMRLLNREQDRRDPDDVLAEAFGAVCEAYHRTMGHKPGQACILAGLALHRGTITPVGSRDDAVVAATFAAAVWALDGGGVHVVTGPSEPPQAVAGRMRPLLQCLGLSVGVLPVSGPGAPDWAARRAAYAASVTVGDRREFGFDYLRDNLAWERDETVQRDLRCAIVLEADAVLLGEAKVPLVISGPDPDAPVRVSLAEITVCALFRRYQRLAGIYADPNADAAGFNDLYRLPIVQEATGGRVHGGSGVRRLLHRAGRTFAAGPVGPRWGTGETDRRTLRYVQVVDDQRDEIYALRRAVLDGIRPPRHTERILIDLVAGLVTQHCPPTAPPAAWNLPALCACLEELYPTRLDPGDLAAQAVDHASLAARCRQDAQAVYGDRVSELGVVAFAELERQVELAVIDRCWRKHLAELTDLWRAVETVDEHSLRRYQLGAAAAFQAMRDTIDREVVGYLFHLEIQVEEVPDTPPARRPPPAVLEQHRRDWKDPEPFGQRRPRPPVPKPPPPAVGPLGLPLEPPPQEPLEERDT